MKKQFIAVTLVFSLLLIGCSGKSSYGNSANANGSSSVTAASSGQGTAETSGGGNKRAEVNTNFKPVKPNTVPKLTPQQKAQLDSKLNSTLKSIDNTLKSLQDAPDINLNSVGK